MSHGEPAAKATPLTNEAVRSVVFPRRVDKRALRGSSKVNLTVLTLRFDLRGSSLVSMHLFKVFSLLKWKEKDVRSALLHRRT